MKTLAEITETLEAFEKKFGVGIVGAQQKSAAWHQVKLGVLSASNAHKSVAKRDSETRNTYMMELVSQVCTGITEEISAKALDWGNQHEGAARLTYEFEHDVKMTEVPFVFKDQTFRAGCSPDGLVSSLKGAEIKCPFNSANFIKFLVDDQIKSEHQWQNQFTLWVMDADEWDFVNYDPRMRKTPIKTLTVKRDAEKQAKFDDLIPLFIEDMDKILAKIGIEFGEQWKLKEGVFE